MKKNFCGALMGLLLLAGASIPALASEGTTLDGTTSGTYHLQNEEMIRGTYQGMHMGQILMKTDAGTNIVLPSMSLFWGTTPQIHLSDLTVGQALMVGLPADSYLRVINNQPETVVLGGYNGVYHIANPTVASWKTTTIEAAGR